MRRWHREQRGETEELAALFEGRFSPGADWPPEVAPVIDRLRAYGRSLHMDPTARSRLRGRLVRAHAAGRHRAAIRAWVVRLAALLACLIVLGLSRAVHLNPAMTPGRSSSRLTVLAVAHVGRSPGSLAIDPHAGADGRSRVYVTSTSGLAVLDERTGALLHTAAGIASPSLVAVDGERGHVFVVDAQSRLRMLAATADLPQLHSAPAGAGAFAIAVDERQGRVFVASLSPPGNDDNCNYGYVSTYDAASGALLRTVPVDVPPGATVVAGRYCSTGFADSPEIMAVDETRGRLLIVAGVFPAARPASRAVSLIDARSGALLRTTNVGVRPFAVAVDGRTGQAFVTSMDRITMLDTETGRVLRSEQSLNATEIVVDAVRGRAYVHDVAGVDVLDAASGAGVSRLAPTPLTVLAMAIDQSPGYVAVLMPRPGVQANDRILELFDSSTGRTSARTRVEGAHGALALDSVNGRIFVVDEQDGTVTSVAVT